MSAENTSSRVGTDAAGGPPRHSPALAVASFTAPIAAWVVSLAGSYVLQDFACSAARSAGRPVPGEGLSIALVVLNAVMLAICVAAGVLGGRLTARTRTAQAPATRFLAGSGILSAALFGYGVVLIGMTPLIYGACQ